MDPYGYDDERTSQLLAAMQGIPIRQEQIRSKLRRGQMLFGTPTPQGAQVGRTYVAASPLEHIAAAMSRIVGGRDMQAAENEYGPLAQQAEQAGLAQAMQARADKRFGQAIQLGGLKRQQEADARAAAHQDATLSLQQQEAARKAAADAEEAKYRAGVLGVQRDGLGLKRQEIAASAEARTASDKDKAKAASAKAAEDLRKEFQGLQTYKNTQTIGESYKKIAGTSDTGAGDVSLIYSYMRMVDPGSTVREGEFATAANAGSVPDRVVGLYNRVLSGEKLPPDVRKQFRDEARNLLKAQADRFEETAKPYRRLAEAQGVSPGDVVLDLGLEGMLNPPGAAASPEDQAAKAWAAANPNDPRAAAILQRLKAKGL